MQEEYWTEIEKYLKSLDVLQELEQKLIKRIDYFFSHENAGIVLTVLGREIDTAKSYLHDLKKVAHIA